MALIKADRVQDVTTTTGTGPFAVSGTAPLGYRSMSAVCAVGDQFFGAVVSQTLNEWNTGLFTYSAANQVTLTAPYEGTSGDNVAVSFSAGTKDVFLTKISKQWGEMQHPGIITGRYYMGIHTAASVTPAAVTANFIYGMPFWVPEKTTFTKIGTRVTVGVAGNIQLAVYNVGLGVPTTKIFSTASQSSAAAGAKEDTTISWVADVGLYFTMFQASATPTVNWVGEYAVGIQGWQTDNGFEGTFLSNQTFGAWPNNPAASFGGGGSAPQVWLRK